MGEHRRWYDLPDGHYAVVDPHGRETCWSVERGRLRDYPPGRRWRPVPPRRPDHVPREQAGQWRDDWYLAVYWPYKGAVAAAIAADPAGAADRFRARYGDPPPPARRRHRRPASPPRRRRPPRPSPDARQQAEALAAHALAQAGMTTRAVAATLEISRMTAWRRIQQGRLLVDGCR